MTNLCKFFKRIKTSNELHMNEQKRKYIDGQSSSFYNDMLKKCMGRGHKKLKYLFNPRITEEWKEGGTLVVGINHWCIQKGCEYYEDVIVRNMINYVGGQLVKSMILHHMICDILLMKHLIATLVIS